MSIAVMSKVWSKSQHKGNALLLLLAIADNANDSGWCWPGIEYLAKKVKVTPQSIIRITRNLEETRELTVLHNRRTGNKYVVRLGVTDEELARVLRMKAPYLDDEQISNILLRNACVTSEVTDNVSSEVTPMLYESSLIANEPSHVATATPAPAKAITEEPYPQNCKTCGILVYVDPLGLCSICNREIEDGIRCADCLKLTATTADMPFVHEVCTCKQEAALTETFGPKPEREERPPPEHWREEAKEPWATWGAESDEFQRRLQRFGDSGRVVQELGFKLQEATGLKPLWGTPKKVKWWSTGLWELYEEAGYSIPVAIEAAKALKGNKKMTVASPYSFVNVARALCAEQAIDKSADNGKPKPYSDEWYDQQMASDQQAGAFS